jgi:L-iditol 2-dehydrogenase
MKQAVMTAPGRIEIRDVTPPRPGEGEVLLRVQRIGVCGSDVHVNHGRHPYTTYPVIQGHELSASIEALGAGVSGLRVGSKVTSLPQVVCGACAPCRRGDEHICDVLKVQGFQAPGCAQELWTTRASKVVELPDPFTFEEGALVEPLSVAIHAVLRAGEVAGRNVAVVGGGPIGNLVAQVVKSEGARVLLTDLSPLRLDLANRCGIELTSNAGSEELSAASRRAFGAAGFDVAFECVGVEATITAAIESIQKGGTLVVVGVFGERPRVDLGLVQDRELNLRGTLMYKRQDYLRAVELIASRRVDVAPLMSAHFPLEEYPRAYQFLDQARDRAMKVFIDVTP